MKISVVSLLREHLGEIAELERLCFSEPWSENSLLLLTEENNFGAVALSDGHVVAYGGMTTVLDEGSITNVAVRPDFQRQGIGRAILTALLSEAKARGIESVFLEVRESNAPARGLYRSAGFSEVGIRRNFYRQPTEHGIQMVWTNQK